MTRIRLITLAVLAIFCVGVVASATAFADEGLEFVNKEGAGHALKKNKFSSTGGAASLFGGITINCTSSTNAGVITSTTGGEVTVTFKGCTALTAPCTTATFKSGEIVTLLGILTTPSNKGTERLLLLTVLKNNTKEAGITSFVCSGIKVEVRGSLLTSNNYKTKNLSKTLALEFKVSGTNKKIQSVTESENSKGEKIPCKGLESRAEETAAFEKSGEEASDTVTFEEEGQFV